jgi:hypothetical protein
MRRRFGLIAVMAAAALMQATTSSAAAAELTHVGSHYYSRTIPKPCFVNVPSGRPRQLALGCNCPAGEFVARAPTATYRFAIRKGRAFRFLVAWGGHKPKISTSQAGPWSYVKVRGPRRCAVVTQIFRVTVIPG